MTKNEIVFIPDKQNDKMENLFYFLELQMTF